MQTLAWDARGQIQKLYMVFKIQVVLNRAFLLHSFFINSCENKQLG